MIQDPRENEFFTNQKTETSEAIKPKTSARLWSTLRNPRIVRVSQAFGGKDRHSKVRTIRGLRDRRVRLSVSTAIQLYDLQDKLGLNQPSKVVDWLLNASKNEIDKLPPLPPIPAEGNLIHFPQSLPSSSSVLNDGNPTGSNRVQTFCNDQVVFSSNIAENSAQFQKTVNWNSDTFMKSRSGRETTVEASIDANGGKYRYDEILDNNMACTFFHQFEPNANQEEATQGFVLASGSPSLISLMPGALHPMIPSAFSLYGNSHSSFQIPSTFAQLLPLNSPRTSLHEGKEHVREQ